MREIFITTTKITAYWEDWDVYIEHEDVYEHFYPGDNWSKDFYWFIPSYAPSGDYSVKVEMFGHIDEDEEDHFESFFISFK